MIQTLTTSGQLYLVNRHRDYLELQLARKKATFLILSILFVINAGAIAWLLQ